MYIDRKDAVKRIKAALKKKTGRVWSVSGGRGTAWNWLRVQAPKKRRVSHKVNPNCDRTVYPLPLGESLYIEYVDKDGTNYYTGDADCEALAQAFGLNRKAHFQGLNISPDEREFYVERVES